MFSNGPIGNMMNCKQRVALGPILLQSYVQGTKDNLEFCRSKILVNPKPTSYFQDIVFYFN